MPGSLLGTQVRRVEDHELLVGRGTFVDNHRVEGLAHAVFVRSPVAHARISGVDTTVAAAAPGVLGVFTSAELGTAPLPSFAEVNAACGRAALAVGTVRYVGDPVALVVAETRAQAVDAAELVDVDYDELAVVADVESALAAEAPLQFEEVGSNVATARYDGDRSDPFAGADRVVRARLVNQRIAVAPIEPNAILVEPGDGSLTVHVSTQQPHMSRDLLARATGIDVEAVRVVAPHVGGAFGGKAGVGPDHGAVALAAIALGRPVAWAETRSEAMLSMQGRGQVQYAELGVTDDGTITGLRLRVLGECGAYAGFGGALAVGPTYLMAQGPYEIPELRFDAVAVMTNTAPVGAFRGAGRPEAAAALERILDVAARELGLPPEEIRRRNLIAPDAFPYATSTGATYDNGEYVAALDEALRIADVDAARAEQQRRRDAGEVRQLGIGIATYVEITGFGGSEYGSVHLHEDGSATVMAGTSAHGQGHATSFSMLVSDRLGIPLERITYRQSDTQAVRTGGGTGGSRSLQLGGNAVRQAADEVHDRAVAIAAQLLEADPGDVELDEAGFRVAGVPGDALPWTAVVAHAREHDLELDSDTDFTQDGATFPFGAHVAIVEVDTETGRVRPLRHVAVDDCGRILNPLLVAGQQHGGAVQGISQALWEEMVYDERGTPLTSSFADYAMPTAADTITLEVSSTETPTPANPLGAKGIGESATVGSTPAVQNAVVDALAHLGVRHVDLPCTPERVWQAIADPHRDPWREPPARFDALASAAAGTDPEVIEA
ncbi:xanthine dehydrogenase family protein molybdopterin-binding subunit [Nocardioides sp. KIGAM211]|uniref:Xanthine dehydrogenase family protein molybdopterin-binding subunit n=1 Tax=Nocardioides luti TaxID=2761101 RepID=A0A7X0RCV5_9ACTN|nr:xanthine dehydrogenase family protein molybdopterin-binding subunit [Nocardioides luti]MBB6625944.1 xanthine dehydrogenase family protein molybdopterin-binding subunit [Nocardioides luti]